MSLFFLLVLSFILGSIPFGKIVGILKGIDIQLQGSGNIGFANSWRVLGFKLALVVLTGDVLKGYLPVYVSQQLFLSQDNMLFVGLVAILGHILSPWLRFKGGKGVATALGVTLALNPQLVLVGIVIYMLTLAFFRIASLSSLTAAFSVMLVSVISEPSLAHFFLIIFIILIITHRTNIVNLINGTEKRIG